MKKSSPLLDVWVTLAEQLKKRDPKLRPIIKAVGPPTIEFGSDPFQALVQSILSQQLATRAAQTIIERFTALQKPFPKPASILKWEIETLRAAGLSGQKASYVIALSQHWQNKTWRSGWDLLEEDALLERLTQVKGIGEWTAHMFLIFCLGKPDVLPVGDYGIRKGVQLLYQTKELPLPQQMRQLTLSWRGASSVASWYVWRGLDKKLIVS